MTRFTFTEDIDRDVIVLKAALAGGRDAVMAVAMTMPDFAGGPDIVDSHMRWMSQPARRPYRQRIADALNAEMEGEIELRPKGPKT